MKKISLVTAAAITASMLSGFCVNAATLTVGMREGFENGYVPDNSKVSVEDAEKYGKVLKLERGDGDVIFNFSENAASGSYVLSMDVNMSTDDPEGTDGKSSLLMYTKTSTKGNAPFLALKDSGTVSTYLDSWQFPKIGNATYTPGEWQRYDFLIDLDHTLPSELYIDGVYAGDFNLKDRGDSTIIDQMGKIHFVLSDAQVGEYALLDNISFTPYTGAATMDAELTDEGKIIVEFSETMSELSASDFEFTRTSKDGTVTENVALTIDYKMPSKVVMTPGDLSDGYVYTLTMADKKTGLNSTISERTATFERLGFDNSDAVIIDKIWDFEDEVLPNASTKIVDEGERGKVLSINKDADIPFKLGQTLSAGKYVYSFDVKTNSSNGYKYFRAYGTSGQWVNFMYFDYQNRLIDAKPDGEPKAILGSNTLTVGEWSRVDVVMDMTKKIADVYFDGDYAGQVELSEKGRAGTSYTLDEFCGAFISNNAGEGGLYVDNIRVRTFEEYYGAELLANENKLYIDFEETTNFDAEDFTVLKTSGLLASSAEEIPFELTYKSGTRAVLTLDENVEPGSRYTVAINELSSILGSKLEDDTVSVMIAQGEINNTIVDDDLSDYTTETILTAEGTPWAGNANAVVTAENGDVTVTGKDSRLWYKFDSAKNGIVTVEMNVNVTTENTGEAVHFNLGNANKKLFFMTQIFNKYVICPTSDNIDKNTYHWNEKSGNISGQDINLKLEFDTTTKKIKVYKDGSLFASGYPYGRDGVFGAGYEDISCIAIDITQDNTTVKISDIKVSEKYTPALVGDVKFIDVTGNVSNSTNVLSTTNKIEISYPQGMYQDEFNGTVELICDGESVGYEGSYDAQTNTYTMTLDNLMGAEKTYEMKIYDTKNSNGVTYNAVEGSFTTGEAVFELSNLDIRKTESGACVSVDCVNTKEDKEYYLIYAGYEGDALTFMDYVPLELTENSTEIEKVVNFDDASVLTHDKISAFIWESFENIVPVIRSVTK